MTRQDSITQVTGPFNEDLEMIRNQLRRFIEAEVTAKAEPWDETVRDKISDPAWSGFFLHYGDSYDYSLPICRDANLSKPGCNTWPACDRSQPPKCSKMCESTKPPPCCLTATLLLLLPPLTRWALGALFADHDQVGRFARWTTNGSLDCGTQPCGECKPTTLCRCRLCLLVVVSACAIYL